MLFKLLSMTKKNHYRISINHFNIIFQKFVVIFKHTFKPQEKNDIHGKLAIKTTDWLFLNNNKII